MGEEVEGGASASSANGRPVKASCAQCGISLEWASLLLSCDHHLCLACSAQDLLRKPSGPVVQCSICSSVTTVDEAAAQYLEGLRPNHASADAGTKGHPPPDQSRGRSEPEREQDASAGDRLESKPPAAFPQPRLSGESRPNGTANGVRGQQPVVSQPSALSAASPTQPSKRRLCGQCAEERPAAVFCEQCEEHFCSQCSDAVHSRGRMAQHQLKLLDASGEVRSVPQRVADGKPPPMPADNAGLPLSPLSLPLSPLSSGQFAGVSELPPKWRVPAADPLVPLQRRFMRCPVHPEEPLQFFCLSCDSACVCAECALHGNHRGHDVLNVREAAARLPDRLQQLSSRAQAKTQEIGDIIEQAKDGKREITSISLQGRRDLRQVFEKLRAALQEEEAALLAEVDRCTADVSEILTIEDPPSEAHARECHENMRRHHRGDGSTDHVQALNWYSKAKKAHAEPPPLRPDIGADLHSQLHGQLQRGFEARMVGVTEVARQIAELAPVSIKAACAAPLGSQSRSESPRIRAPEFDGANSPPIGEWPSAAPPEADARGAPPRLAALGNRGSSSRKQASPLSDAGGYAGRAADGPGIKLASWASVADEPGARQGDGRPAVYSTPNRSGMAIMSPGTDRLPNVVRSHGR